jgi:putative transposase
VYTDFRNWRQDGTWVRLHDCLRECVRLAQGRDRSPCEASIDRQSGKTAAGVQEAVGYDAGKQIKGRKRFAMVDTLGLLLAVRVVAASVSEREGGNQLLQPAQQRGTALSRLHTIWVDGGLDGEPFLRWVLEQVILRKSSLQ